MEAFVYHENASDKGSFTRTGDAWCVAGSQKVFAVADSPIRCLVRDTKRYPFDDYGYEAASRFCEEFVKYGENFLKLSSPTIEDFRKVLISCNKGIRNLNIKLGKKYDDPLNYDIAETVGVGAVIKGIELFYGGLEDCYINVLRGRDLEDVSKCDYQIMKASKYIDKLSQEGRLNSFIPNSLKSKLKKESAYEPCWCNHLRNNSSAFDEEGKLVGWGCFTGEKKAEPFIQVHSLKLNKGDNILAFSDGMIPVLSNNDFLKWLLQNATPTFHFQYQMRLKIMELLKESKDAHKEKTLIYIKFD